MSIRFGADDHEPIEQVKGNTVGAFIFGASDFSNAAIGGNDENGCHVGF